MSSSWYRDLVSQLNESISEIEDGYMKHPRDIAGLEEYLKQMNILPKDAVLMPMQDFEEAIEDGVAHGSIYGYYVNLDERGDFNADVRDVHGKTVYEVVNQDDEPEDFDDEEDDFEESDQMVDEADVAGDSSGMITLKLSRKEAEIVAEALNHVGREVFDKEGDGRILIDIARKLRST